MDPQPNTPAPARRRRKRPSRRGERGVALLLALISIALLAILATQLREEVEVYATAAAVSRDQVLAEYQARSVVNLSRLLLHSEPAIRRSLTPVLAPMMAMMGRGLEVPQIPIWEQSDMLLGAFRNREGAESLASTAGVDIRTARGLGALTGASPARIIDEDSKINVNGLDRSPIVERRVAQQLLGLIANPSLDPYFTGRDPDGQHTDRLALVGAMVDFADSDVAAFDVQSLVATNAAASGSGGSEDLFYTNLHPPYVRRNAPLDSVEDLRLVRGLGDDDLWSSVIDPDPGNPRRRTVTVWGQGLVNVNTANAQTILALLCSSAPTAATCTDPNAASQFMTGITMIQAFTTGMGIPVFSSPRQFVQTIQGQPPMGQIMTALGGSQPIQLADPAALERATTTESKVFSIYAEATVGLAHSRIHVVVDMRAQPGIPSTFTQPMTGFVNRTAAATTQLVTTSTGISAAVARAGGTILYWRED